MGGQWSIDRGEKSKTILAKSGVVLVEDEVGSVYPGRPSGTKSLGSKRRGKYGVRT
jgi:hypothetical protein